MPPMTDESSSTPSSIAPPSTTPRSVTSEGGAPLSAEGGAQGGRAGEEQRSEASKGDAGRAERPAAPQRVSRSGRVPVDEIANGIAQAGRQMSSKLRELLLGTVVLRIVDRSRAFSFDPKDGGFAFQETQGAAARNVTGDCVVDLTELSLQRMWNGELNPQIAMLSDKITISGKADLAVYFFNLVSPK
jgi:hypothetical protein